MAIYSRTSIQNIDNWRFWDRKNKFIIKDTKKRYIDAKDSYEAKYQYLISKREKVGLKHYDDVKAFIKYSNDMQEVYKNIDAYNPGKNMKY